MSRPTVASNLDLGSFLRQLATVMSSGVAVIWGPPDYGDPHANITSDIGMGVIISLSDMRLPRVPITLAVWGSSVIIWGSLILQRTQRSLLVLYPAR